jgi:epoxyqueuosine reductase
MKSYILKENSIIVKQTAKQLGFDFCGISKAEKLSEEETYLESYLKENRHGKMGYMENHFDKRLDPTLLVPGAKSLIVLLFNYYTKNKQIDDTYKISKYAYGKDYHFIIKDKLKELVKKIEEKLNLKINGRIFVDSAPVLERAWAAKSGLGWIGKNTMLINKTKGSFFFIAEIISDLELEPDGPIKDYCGTCNACIEACPTGAIEAPNKLNGSKCISYLTIELKDEIIPDEFKNKMDDWIFGCDICQDVCPWNRFAVEHSEINFRLPEEIKNLTKKDWEELDEIRFKVLFKNSPLKRTKYKGLKRNITYLYK